jgi:hypothetical protein
MPKRISRPKRPTDPNEWARQMVDESTGNPPEPENSSVAIVPFPKAVVQKHQQVMQTKGVSIPGSAKSERAARKFISIFMAEMGRKGGKIGGKRRLETLTPEKRRELALRAAKARWEKNRDITNKDTRVTD